MSDTETVDIDKRYKTVGELLEATCHPQNYLGKGNYAAGYKFPNTLGMDNFALRIKKDLSLKELAGTTSLVSLPELVTCVSIGQPMMVLDAERFAEVSIMKRQHGKSLEEIRLQLLTGTIPSENSETEAAIALINRVLALKERNGGKNPFAEILQIARSLRLSKENPDLSRGNLILDDESHALRLADQITMRRSPSIRQHHHSGSIVKSTDMRHDINRLFTEISRYNKIANEIDFTTPLGKRYQLATQRLEDMLMEAMILVEESRPQVISFFTTHSTHAIALTDPPSKLVVELNRLHGIVNAPQR